MGKFVTAGALLRCSFGMAPSNFMVPDPTRPKVQGKPVGNIGDNKPMMNIMPFGMCRSMANPQVASATAAACGVLTPMPCMPVIAAPWMPGGKEMIKQMPALLNNCKCMCNWGGNISVNFPGNACLAEGK